MKIVMLTGFSFSLRVLDIITHQSGAFESCPSEINVAHHFVPMDRIIMHVVVRDRKLGISPRVRSANRIQPPSNTLKRRKSKAPSEYNLQELF